MKINPIGIQSYQQIGQQNSKPAQRTESEETRVQSNKLQITPQEKTESKLAVEGPKGSFAEFLSTEERAALDLLFTRFRDSDRFGPGFKRDASAESTETIGRVVDVKV